MKFFLSLAFTLIGFGLAIPKVAGQSRIEFNENGQSGKINFLLEYWRDNSPNNTRVTSLPAKINLQGAANATVSLRFINGDNIRLDRNYRLVVRVGCFKANSFLNLNTETDVQFVARKNINSEGRFVFNILKNGATHLKIGYNVVHKDSIIPLDCKQEFSIPLEITGLSDPSEQECKAALALISSNKPEAFQKLEQIWNKYPNASCKQIIEPMLEEYRMYQNAREKSNKNCAEARTVCLSYQKKYQSNNSFWQAEIQAILNQCPEKKKVPEPVETNNTKTVAQVIPEYKNDWNLLQKNKPLRENLLVQYINRYENIADAAEYVKLARSALTQIAPLRVLEERVSDFERVFTISNASRPRWKDMSMIPGLNVDDHALQTEGKIRVQLESGEFALRITDENKKDTTIRFSNAFSGQMNTLPENKAYFIQISGGRKPYRIDIENMETGSLHPIELNIRSDTVLIQSELLKKKGLNGDFRVRLRGSGQNEEVDLGVIHNGHIGFDVTRILIVLTGLLAVAVVIHLLIRLIRKRRHKKTIQQYTYTH